MGLLSIQTNWEVYDPFCVQNRAQFIQDAALAVACSPMQDHQGILVQCSPEFLRLCARDQLATNQPMNHRIPKLLLQRLYRWCNPVVMSQASWLKAGFLEVRPDVTGNHGPPQIVVSIIGKAGHYALRFSVHKELGPTEEFIIAALCVRPELDADSS